MTVECSHERVRAGDSDQGDPARRGYIDHFRQHIRVEGELTQEQRERIEYIAGQCPHSPDADVHAEDNRRGGADKLAIRGALPVEIDAMNQKVPILVYHHVYPDAEPGTQPKSLQRATGIIGESEFRRHVAYFAEHGWEVVSTSRVVDWLDGGAALPKRAVALHFDNGWLDAKTVALPILQEYGFTATSYVITGRDKRGIGGQGRNGPHLDRGGNREAVSHLGPRQGAAGRGLGDRRPHGHAPQTGGCPGEGG